MHNDVTKCYASPGNGHRQAWHGFDKKIHRMLWFAPVFLVSLEKTGDINLVHSFEVFFKQYGILYANLDYYRNVLGSGTDDLPGKAISSVSH